MTISFNSRVRHVLNYHTNKFFYDMRGIYAFMMFFFTTILTSSFMTIYLSTSRLKMEKVLPY